MVDEEGQERGDGALGQVGAAVAAGEDEDAPAVDALAERDGGCGDGGQRTTPSSRRATTRSRARSGGQWWPVRMCR